MPADLSFLPRDPVRVDEVSQDIIILDAVTVAHYVVDPFEISTFCFPAQRAESQSWSWKETINNVVALYEVFYGHTQHPVLLDEYKHELIGAIRHFQQQADLGLDGTERFQKEIRQDHEQDLEGEQDLSRDFTATLAVAIGVFSEGFSRLKDLLAKRLVATEINPTVDAAALRECFNQHRYSPSFAIDVAVQCLRTMIKDYELVARRPMSAKLRQRYRNSIIVDAQATARLVEIQAAALRAFEKGRLRQRHLFYYVSSAERTAPLFNTLKEQGRLPFVDGEVLSMWRTPRQILLRLVCTDQDDQVTLRRLRKVRNIVDILKGQDAASLEESSLPWEIRSQLEDYRRSIFDHYRLVQNYGLASLFSAGEHFHRLLEEKSDANWVQKAREEIRRFTDHPEWKKKSRELVSLNLFFTGVKISLADSLLHNFAVQRRRSSSDERHSTRSGRDPVAGSRQHLPTIFRVMPEGYEDIVDSIKRYFETPIHGRFGRETIIGQACTVFLDRDRASERLGVHQIGHELVRNLLFLALPPADADQFALDHAQEMLVRIEDLLNGAEDPASRATLVAYEREFIYLACWAARRQADYQQGEILASAAIDKYSKDGDPRFHHARCLNTYAWFSDYRDSNGSKPGPGVSIERAIQDARLAAEGYRNWGTKAAGQAGVLFNTIACLYVYGLDELYDVRAARTYLDLLKNEVDKGTWLDRFPEYFHTEALVEFEEFKSLKKAGAERSELRDKLGNARREIEFAYSMYQENTRAALKHRDKVEVLRSQILDAIRDCE